MSKLTRVCGALPPISRNEVPWIISFMALLVILVIVGVGWDDVIMDYEQLVCHSHHLHYGQYPRGIYGYCFDDNGVQYVVDMLDKSSK